MKRSQVNKALKALEAMCAEYKFSLPPFCHMTPAQWQEAGHEWDEVRDCMGHSCCSTQFVCRVDNSSE